MFFNRFLFVLCLFCLPALGFSLPKLGFSQELKERPTLLLGQGEQRLLHIEGLKKYSLGSPAVRVLPLGKGPRAYDGKENKDFLLIKGVAPGIGDLWVWKKDGSSEHRTIRVETTSPADLPKKLERAIGTLQEVEVIFTGNGVVLRGDVHTPSEAARIAALSSTFPKEVLDETQVSETLLSKSKETLELWLEKTKQNSQIRVEQEGNQIWLKGSAKDTEHLRILERGARARFPLVKLEIDTFPDHAPTIYFRVFLLELKKQNFRSFGLSWPGEAHSLFQVTPGSIQSLYQIDLTLQQLEGSGNAKILSNPELVVRAPGEAELFAGGEIPIQAKGKGYSKIHWRNYGMSLKLKVTHFAGNRVRLEIFTEVSHLDPQLSSNKIPGIQANRMKTQVDAPLGTPLFLSGLLQQAMKEEARGLPFLRNIPVLGHLFGSEDYLNQRSELVAILYPHLNPPRAPMEKVSFPSYPQGPIPPPRNWISPQNERNLRENREYPWNALE